MAQTATDGELALTRGDFAAAVQILRPLAEDLRRSDPLAQFYMASLYERGQGVAPDRMRACALLARVSFGPMGDPNLPITSRNETLFQLRDQAQEKVRAFQQAMSPEEFDECLLLSSLGFDHKFEPATYVLETGRWVEVSVRGARIWSQGKSSQLFKWALPGGTQFLPTRYSEIASGRPEATRHFLEIFAWAPEGQRWDTWHLRWRLFEIVGSELTPIIGEVLATITAPAPPAASSLNVHEMASVTLNQAGLIEWRTRGAQANAAVIPSDAERRAHENEIEIRRAAGARVDWNRVGDVRRNPGLAYSATDGCGHVVVHGWSEDRMEAIQLRADSEALRLSSTTQTFDIAMQLTTLALTVHVYARPVRSSPFCTDIVQPTGPFEEWRALSGEVAIAVAPFVSVQNGQRMQRATVRISRAVFVNTHGVRVTQVQPITLTGTVGWIPG